VHGLGVAGLAIEPAAWPQILGGLACNQGFLLCGMHPRSGLIGRNMRRLPGPGSRGVAITFDDGPHPEVTPRVLDILDAYGVQATFFVIGQRAARHSALVREMVQRGHRVENHTHRHPLDFAAWGPWRLRREIVEAQRAIADASGRAPRYFRAPMGLRSPLLDPVLAVEGLSLVSWTRRGYDTVSRRPDLVLRRLTRGLVDGDILLLHDGTARIGLDGAPVALTVLPKLLERIAAAGLRTAMLPDGDAQAEERDAASRARQAEAAAPACPAPGGCA
jgi:peptidoglycan/xylan/chitin deacetylase (PgdA/CDA1 family)